MPMLIARLQCMHTPSLPPQAAPMSTSEAEAYARRVEELGRRATADPVLNLDYGDHPGQRVDVYEPQAASNAPVLVFLHGGAWTHGGLEWLRFMAPAVVSLPAVLIGVTYRLAPEHRWPAAFDDVCAALDRIHECVLERGYDNSRVVIGGHSAGGHLASLAVLRNRYPWVRACFPVSSRFDLRTSNPKPGSGEERVYKLVLADPSQDADASPLRFVQKNTTPFHIVWGENDFERIISSSHAMVDALEEQGCAVTHTVVPGAGHFDTHLALETADNSWYQRLKKEFELC